MKINRHSQSFLDDAPTMLYGHFRCHGPEAPIFAQTLANVLLKTARTSTAQATADPAPSRARNELQRRSGAKGTITPGVLAVGVPRPLKDSMRMGVQLPPTGYEWPTSLKFSGGTATGRFAVVTGDFRDDWRRSEIGLPRRCGITTQHHGCFNSHMMDGTPLSTSCLLLGGRSPDKVGAGLKAGAGLDLFDSLIVLGLTQRSRPSGKTLVGRLEVHVDDERFFHPGRRRRSFFSQPLTMPFLGSPDDESALSRTPDDEGSVRILTTSALHIPDDAPSHKPSPHPPIASPSDTSGTATGRLDEPSWNSAT